MFVFNMSEEGKKYPAKTMKVIALVLPVFFSFFFIPFYFMLKDMVTISTLILIFLGFLLFIEIIIIVAGLLARKSNRNKQLIIDNECITGDPLAAIQFDDVKEVIVKKNKNSEVTGITLVHKKDTLCFIGGYEKQAEILKLILDFIHADIPVIEKTDNFSLNKPWKNIITALIKGFLIYFGLVILIVVFVGLVFLILKILNINISGKIMGITGILIFISILAATPLIRKILRRKFF